MMEFKYDLAISLCEEDCDLAWNICNELGNIDKIFFYKKDVDDLSFKNGNNIFGDVFSTQSRFILVLFRSNYGETDWTAVEYNIISDKYKKTVRSNNSPILFCRLDDSPVPNWLPETYIYSKVNSKSGITDLVKKIRKNILDHGGVSIPRTVDQMLSAHIDLKRYEQDYDQKMYSNQELATKSQNEAGIVIDLLKKRFQQSAMDLSLNFYDIPVHSQLPELRIIYDELLLIARYEKTSSNSIDRSNLYIELFTVENKRMIIPANFSNAFNVKKSLIKFDIRFYITSNEVH